MAADPCSWGGLSGHLRSSCCGGSRQRRLPGVPGTVRWEDGFCCPGVRRRPVSGVPAPACDVLGWQRRTSVTAGTISIAPARRCRRGCADLVVTSQKNGGRPRRGCRRSWVRLRRDGVRRGCGQAGCRAVRATGPAPALPDRRGRTTTMVRHADQSRHLYATAGAELTVRRAAATPPSNAEASPSPTWAAADRASRLDDQDRRRTGAAPARRPDGFTHQATAAVQRRRPVLSPARRAPGRLDCQRWMIGILRLPRSSSSTCPLPRRVHLPLQPAHRTQPRPAVLPAARSKP